MATINIKAHTNNSTQVEAIKAFMKALKIKFELSDEQSPYSSEFVEKIKQGDADKEAQKGRKIKLEDLDDLWK